MSNQHIPVLLEEAVDSLVSRVDGWYFDGTFGRGGHSRAILARLSDAGRVFATDRDASAAEVASTWQDSRFHFARGEFSQLPVLFPQVVGKLDGVLLDLGVSSPQLDVAERGFSFQKSGPLDMRMNQDAPLDALGFLMGVEEAELARLIRDLGGEPHGVAKRIATRIIAARSRLHTTLDLAEVIADAVPRKFHRAGYHPATQTFQAIRMVVNDELGEIERGLAAAIQCLRVGGVLAVISFHGVEDALVKRFIRRQEGKDLPAEIPLAVGRQNQVLRLISPVIKPSAAAIAENPRCRSARLRRAVRV